MEDHRKTFRRIGSDDVTELVVVSDFDDKDIHFAALGGGFVTQMSIADFNLHFESVSPEELDILYSKYVKKPFTLESWNYEKSVLGWTNGLRWNGWECPLFEKEDILEAIRSGDLTGQFNKILLDEDGSAMIYAQGDEPIPQDYDFSELIARAKQGEELWEIEIFKVSPDNEFEKATVSVEFFPVQKLQVEGREVTTYMVGYQSITWEAGDEPTPAPGL